MAYQSITDAEIATGMPVASSTQTKVQENFEDHEARLQTVEGGGAVTYPPLILSVSGYYSDFGTMVGVVKTTCNFNLTVTGIRLIILEAGSANTTEVDILKSSGGAYSSLLTTKPSVSYSAGNDATSSNAVLDPTKVDLVAGDKIRLDVTAVQTNGKGFLVRIDYIKT